MYVENSNKLFKTMFSDSNIAKQFTCGERKGCMAHPAAW